MVAEPPADGSATMNGKGPPDRLIQTSGPHSEELIANHAAALIDLQGWTQRADMTLQRTQDQVTQLCKKIDEVKDTLHQLRTDLAQTTGELRLQTENLNKAVNNLEERQERHEQEHSEFSRRWSDRMWRLAQPIIMGVILLLLAWYGLTLKTSIQAIKDAQLHSQKSVEYAFPISPTELREMIRKEIGKALQAPINGDDK